MISSWKTLYKQVGLALVGAMFFVAVATPAKADVSSIMINAETGEVLSAQRADKLRYPASLTKLMTLYIAFDALDRGIIKMDDELPVSRKAANRSPSRLGLKPGSKISVKSLNLNADFQNIRRQLNDIVCTHFGSMK